MYGMWVVWWREATRLGAPLPAGKQRPLVRGPQGNNLWDYNYGVVVLVRGEVCDVDVQSYDEITCAVDFDAAVSGDLVVVASGDRWDADAAWWDIASGAPVAVEGASWCPDPCPVEPVVTGVSCDVWPWPVSAEACLTSWTHNSVRIEVRAACCADACGCRVCVCVCV